MAESDKRRHPRLPREEPLSIRLVIPSDKTGEKSTQIYGSSVDMSASGLQLQLDHELKAGQQLEIWIVLVDDHDAYNLHGEVTWSRPAEQGGWLAGIVLDMNSPDFRAWDELFR